MPQTRSRATERPAIRRRLRVPCVAATLAGLSLLAACYPGRPGPVPGTWRAWLDSPGGSLPFLLELVEHDGLHAFVINGSERIAIPQVHADGRRLTLSIGHYDSRIVAAVSGDGTRLDGEWTKTGAGGRTDRLPFHATHGEVPRFQPAARFERGMPDVSGRWRVQFAEDANPSVGLFERTTGAAVEGTFLNTTGDYRYLAGDWDGRSLRLSTFDGAHAFLFVARLREDGTLSGEFWSRDSWHETWTARRDPEAELPDAFSLTQWVPELDLGTFHYPDLDGRLRSLADPEFTGRARIIELFGTWCPNCNDAARYLGELDRRYGERGLSILGLAFEHTGDLERDADQLRRYVEHHEISFPILLAGVSDKTRASETFPLVDRIRAYPTLIFLDQDNRVRGVYQGFCGPATGPAHRRLRERIESLIESLL